MKPFWKLGIVPWLAGCLLAVSSAWAQPTFIEHPVSLTVRVGSNVTFSVDALGRFATYQWWRNGMVIPNSAGRTLYITNVQPHHCGILTATARDSDGTARSLPAKLQVSNIALASGNDMFDQAWTLAPNGGVLRGWNTNATVQMSEPRHAGKAGGKSVWFQWTAPANGILTVSSAGSHFDTLLGVYTGHSLSIIDPLGDDVSDNDSGGYFTSRSVFNAVAGEDYQIALDGVSKANGFYILEWDFESTLERIPRITSIPKNRTMGPGGNLDLTFAGTDFQSTTWLFNKTTTSVTDTKYSILGMDATKVGIYQFTIASTSARITTSPQIEIQMHQFGDGTTDTNSFAFDKVSDLLDLPPNQLPSPGGLAPASPPIHPAAGGTSRGYSSTQVFSTVGATKDPDEPDHCGETGGASEWYAYQASSSGTFHINTDGSSFDTVLAVYTWPPPSTNFATMLPMACANVAGNGGDRVRFPAVSNTVYYIAVDGVDGAHGTASLRINLGDPPVLTSGPQDRTVLEGSNATFTVTVSGSTNFSYRWYYNATNLITGATAASYTVTNAKPSKVGTYTVVVSNLINVVTSAPAVLSLYVAPTIVTQPTNQTANVYGSAAFTVVAAGVPVPTTCQWQFTNRVNGYTNIPGATQFTLSLTNLTTNQAGPYRVVVTNLAGAVTSAPAVLTVQAPPVFITHPQGQTAASNSTVVLSVAASGTPAPGYLWYRNGSVLAGATSASLTIPNFRATNEGRYQVLASNLLGTVMSSNVWVLLNAPMRLAGASRNSNGTFQLRLAGLAGSNYILQASTSLTNWVSLATNPALDGLIEYLDTAASNNVRRFYRIRQGP